MYSLAGEVEHTHFNQENWGGLCKEGPCKMLRGHYPHEDAYTSLTSLCLII